MVFKWGDEVVREHKLEQIESSNQIATELATLLRHASFFAIAVDADEDIYLSGSRDGQGD